MKKYALSVVAPAAIIVFICFYIFTHIYLQQPAPVKTSGAFESLRYWTEQRAYPNNGIPETGLMAAYEHTLVYFAADAPPDSNEWETIGPHNFGGRTIGIAFNPLNPNTIYAGSASGGLWRSYTGGEGVSAWEYVETGFPVHGVSSIAISPVDTNIILIGTGEVYNKENTQGGVAVRETRGSYGIGILKTTDGGSSWTKSIDWTQDQKKGVWQVKFNPYDPNTLWAATTEGTYKSYDQGENWTLVHPTVMATDLLIMHADTSIVLVACGNLQSIGRGIYRTTDGGANWTKLTNGLPSDFGGKILLHAPQNSQGLIYASIGNGYFSNAGTWLCKTTDYGDTWTVVNTDDYSTYQGWFSHFVIVQENNHDILLTAGVDVFKSTNGGTVLNQQSYWYNWDMGRTPIGGPEGPDDYSHADHHCFAVHPTDPNIVYFGNDGGVFRTTDFGETFEGLNGGYQTQQFYNGLQSSLTDSAWMIGGFQDNASAIYDGDLAWIRVVGGDGGWGAVNQQYNNILYGSLQGGRTYRSTDGGVSFVDISPNRDGRVAFIAPYVVSPINSDIMYHGSGKPEKSTNRGTSWSYMNGASTLTPNPPISMVSGNVNEDHLYITTAPVITGREIFRTTDGGATFTEISAGLPDRYPTDISVGGHNDSIVVVVFSGFGTPHVFRSVDHGDNWMDISGDLPDIPVNSVLIDPRWHDNIYIGTDIGMFCTTDAGANWLDYNQGMIGRPIVLSLSFAEDGYAFLFAGTHGNGAFKRRLPDVPVNVDDHLTELPGEFELRQNFPNPFNPSTVIEYTIKTGAHVNLSIFDPLGRRIVTLFDGYKQAGTYKNDFDASELAAGVYYYRLEAGNFSKTKKMLFLK